MPLVNTKDMFRKRIEADTQSVLNVNNMEIIQGIVNAASKLRAPLILQVSAGARRYANQTYLLKLVEPR